MIRIYHIDDPTLRDQVRDTLAQWRGCSPSDIPDWFEIDDADYSEILMILNHPQNDRDFVEEED